VIVTHVGGVYGDPKASLERFAQRYKGLSAGAQRRLVLENDENRYSLIDTYGLHEETGIRLVLDRLHHLLNNPARLSIRQALDLTLSTWPEAQTPKIHFSSPRTEFKVVPEEAAAGDGEIERLSTPSWRNHADYINPFEFANFLRAAEGSRDFDVMLETKAKDLALLRLREDLTWYTPELAKRWGLDT
jgi:UV DNA damage endonuclease